MRTDIELNLEMNEEYDVIVAGGGPSGCTAAAAAAREGMRVLLIEGTSCLGGMATSGLVPAWVPFADGVQVIYRGLAERIFNRNKKDMKHVKGDAVYWVPLDSEGLKRQLDELMEEFGVKVLFNTLLSYAKSDDSGGVEYLLLSNKEGISAYSAKVYIDCTGDADLAGYAGAKREKGGKNGELQPATHCFVLANVDDYAYVNGEGLHPNNPNSPVYEMYNDKRFQYIDDTHLCNNSIGPATVGFNAGHIWNVDNTNVDSVSKALVRGRRIAKDFKDALGEYHPAFKNAYLVSTGNLMGIRETVRIVGDYILTIEDYLNRASFDDEIARNCYYIDIHNTQEEIEEKVVNINAIDGRYDRYADGESHGIPYRCLIPAGLHNVLVAGRSISTDRIVQGSTRVMPTCMVMGEAAGMAAAMTDNSGNVRGVDVNRLRKKLRENGNYLP